MDAAAIVSPNNADIVTPRIAMNPLVWVKHAATRAHGVSPCILEAWPSGQPPQQVFGSGKLLWHFRSARLRSWPPIARSARSTML